MTWRAPLYRLYERRLQQDLESGGLPSHIGVILDGHRRFARAERLADYQQSYRTGMAKAGELLEWCAQLGIPVVTAWVLSTDNLRRPQEELDPYYDVLIEMLAGYSSAVRTPGLLLRCHCSLDLLPIASRPRPRTQCSAVPVGAFGSTSPSAMGAARRSSTRRVRWSSISSRTASSRDDLRRRSTRRASRHTSTPRTCPIPISSSARAASRVSPGSFSGRPPMPSASSSDPYWPAFRRVDFLRALRDYARRERRFGR